jgi:hypothetical protein
MARLIRRFGAALAVAAVAALTGCVTASPDDAWVLEPIRHDNRLDDEGTAQLTDVTFPMRLSSDTAGGTWGTSAGSWLHLDADGETVRRFNLEPGDAPRVDAIAALSPTELAATASTAEITDTARAVMLFDTEAMSWQVLQAETDLLGDIAVQGDAIYYVRFTWGAPSFTVKRITLGSDAGAELVSPEITGAPEAVDASGVALDIGPDGTLYLATRAERITVSPAGELVDRVAVPSAWPFVAVSPSGEVLWSSGPQPTARPQITLVDASPEASTLIESSVDCDEDGLAFGPAILPLCPVRGIAWLDDGTLVISVGGEAGAPLVRVRPPLIEG